MDKGYLVLTLKSDELVEIPELGMEIKFKFTKDSQNKIKAYFKAPKNVKIFRRKALILSQKKQDS